MQPLAPTLWWGFPGETDALFQESFDFIAAQPFTYLHLFPFSARPGTRAWALSKERPVPPQAVAERLACLRDLISVRNRSFRRHFVGRSLPAVTLHAAQNVFSRALTDNFLEVSLAAHLPANQNVRVEITGLTETGLSGHVNQ